MTIQQFIEKAVEGGWADKARLDWFLKLPEYAQCQIWLDPKAWQAVGKMKGWGREYYHEDDGKTYWDFDFHCPMCGAIETNIEYGCPEECIYDNPEIISWKWQMYCMIDALCEGKTIEQYLESL